MDSVRDRERAAPSELATALPQHACESATDPGAGGRQRHLIKGARGAKLQQHLQSHIPGDRIRALASGQPMPDRVRGAALFADISGFTSLTEALAAELGAHRGAEELTLHLNRVFHELIGQLDGYGGDVIYFSGDAITCWFDGDDGLRATTCAFAMQHTMQRMHEIVTPRGSRVTLAMKVAIAVGAARRFVVGDPGVQLMDVLAGALIEQLAATEHLALPGEIVLDQSALESLAGRVRCGEPRIDDANGRRCAPVVQHPLQAAGFVQPGQCPALPESMARQWLLPELYEKLAAGSGEFITELRPAYPLFASFAGIDYDRDDEAPAKLDAFIRRVQRILFTYGGNLIHLSLGDKGGYLYGVFGAPQAHEDDAARAASAALELRELPRVTPVESLQIGVTYGRLRSGMYGHERRQAFTCLGDAVNLAARLMVKSPPGQIYVSGPVHDAVHHLFECRPLAPIQVKGKREAVQAFELTGHKQRIARDVAVDSSAPMIGRAEELAQLRARLESALSGDAAVVGIAAEAGMGKSRLIAEFAREARARGVVVVSGECQAFGTNTSYFAWRDVWTSLLGLHDAHDGDKVAIIEAHLASIDPALSARAPLLAPVVDVAMPDNELTATFDAKLRKASLEALLSDCLRARASSAPLVVVLEDCHWLDQLSRDLLEALVRSLPGLRCLFVLAYRPAREVGGGLGLEKIPYFAELTLAELGAAEARSLIAARAKPIFGVEGEPPQALVDLVIARAQGNPFYIEELLNFLRGKGVDPDDPATLATVELPDSLHSLILSRIDALSESPRQTLKVASVLGRVFRAAMLPGVYPQLGALEEVKDHLDALRSVDLVNLDQEEAQSYLFKHVVTQEVAYESMPFGFRSMLHERVGGYIETVEAEAVERNLDLLAHHYWHSDNLAKKREYLRRAGVAAQAAYANKAAIEYFERLAPLVEERAKIDALLKLGSVLDVIGEWKRAEDAVKEALALAERLDDPGLRAAAQTALADIARKQGRFDEALALLHASRRGFEALGDRSGLGRIEHLLGTVAAQRGDYDAALRSYELSLSIREQLDDKPSMGSLLSNMGIIAEYRGDYTASRDFHDRAMVLRTAVGDRRAIAISAANLGMIALAQKRYAEAREFFDRCMLLSREVGDVWMAAVCNTNLGNASRGMGEYDVARRHYAESLRVQQKFEDRWSLAFLLEDVAMLAAAQGDAPSALELLGAADALRDASKSPRPPSQQEEVDHSLAGVLEGMSERERQLLRSYGRSLDLAAALDHALALCEEPAPRASAKVASAQIRADKRAAWIADQSRPS